MNKIPYIKNIAVFALLVVIQFFSNFAYAQIEAVVDRHESAEGAKDGIIAVNMPDDVRQHTETKVYCPDGSEVIMERSMLAGLEAGLYQINVYPKSCPEKLLYTQGLVVKNEDEELRLELALALALVTDGARQTDRLSQAGFGCDEKWKNGFFCYLYNILGGVPPYQIHWADHSRNHLTGRWDSDGIRYNMEGMGFVAESFFSHWIVGNGYEDQYYGVQYTDWHFSTADGFDGTILTRLTVTDMNGKEVKSPYLSFSTFLALCSQDPNQITGPSGYDTTLRYVAAESQMDYTIEFENDSTLATAPATRVSVRCPIPDNINLGSFELGSFGFADHLYAIPAHTNHYTQRIDLSDEMGIWLDLTAGIDVTTREAFWNFNTIDPTTGFEVTDPTRGFLAINDSLGNGQGNVHFSVKSTSQVASGDTVGLVATIVFDNNESINTNVWTNTFDAQAPVSQVTVSHTDANPLECTITVHAQDEAQGSGIRSVQLYRSVDGGELETSGYVSADTTITSVLQEGHIYRFAASAVDNVGHVEQIKNASGDTIDLNLPPTAIILSRNRFLENDSIHTLIGTVYTFDNSNNQNFTFQLVAGEGDDDNDRFLIQGNQLLTNGRFQCNDTNEYSVRIGVTDAFGLSYAEPFTLYKTQQNFSVHNMAVSNICSGSSYQFGSRQLTEAGQYQDTLKTTLGCDSIVRLSLNVRNIYQHASDTDVCQTQSFVWNGHSRIDIPTMPGYYQLSDSLLSSYGCDSIVMLNLTLRHDYDSAYSARICEGDSLDYYGRKLYEDGNYDYVVTSASGCDTSVRLQLVVDSLFRGIDELVACDSLVWRDHNKYYSSTSVPVFRVQNDGYCDSLIRLNLTVQHCVHQTYCLRYTLAVQPNNNAWGSCSGGGDFPENTNVQIMAIPKPNHRFVRWSDGNVDNPRTILVTGDITLQAVFQ